MAESRSTRLIKNLDFAVTVRRNEDEIIEVLSHLEPGEERTISITSEQAIRRTYQVRIARP